jgi:GT2 family glycosyltransferase
MRRDTLERVGPFDEAYWMYMEDLDLCYRFQAAGYVNWFEPDVAIVHVKAGTSGKQRRAKLNAAFHYGMFRFYRDHYAPRSNPMVNGAVYAGILAKLGVSLVTSAFRRRRAIVQTR